MKVPARIQDLPTTVKKLIAAVSGQLDLYDNLKCKIIDVTDTGAANVEFTVTHSLGVVPEIYIYNIDRTGYVYDSSRATWTTSTMTLKCSAANAALKLVIF